METRRGDETIIFGVVTHVIIDTTTEEFDDSPLMCYLVVQSESLGWGGAI